MKYWPVGNSEKEINFVKILTEVIEIANFDTLQPLINSIFKRVVKNLVSPHLMVCDQTMCMFENDYFLRLVRMYKEDIFPLIVKPITELAQDHWHPLLKQSFKALSTIVREIDPILFSDTAGLTFLDHSLYSLKQSDEKRKLLDSKWCCLETQILSVTPEYTKPEVPFASDLSLGVFNHLYQGISSVQISNLKAISYEI